jgi:BirA family biotin operon repressor/biotin-[acetyl-CoA-carboxylase] ligase
VHLDVRRYASLPSTMTVASAAAEAGAPEGVVIVADEQTKGRGRRGRNWSSPAGAGLYLSMILRPRSTPQSPQLMALITLAAGVGVRSAIHRATGLAPHLKWPNDVMVERRKLAGVLAEGVGIGSSEQTIILGLGVNVLNAQHAHEVASRATSLEAELGRYISREAVLAEILVAVPEVYGNLERGEVDDILRAWRDVAPTAVGAEVEWAGHHGTVRGVTAGIDEGGALLVRTTAGLERVISGEVRWC